MSIAASLSKLELLRMERLRASKLFREFVLFGSSTILYQASRFIVLLVVASIVGPRDFGIWNLLNLVLVYGAYAPLGVGNGMNRDVPLFKGRGNVNKVREVRSVSAGFIGLSTMIIAACLVLIAPFVVDSSTVLALRLVSGLFLVFQLYNFCQIYLVSDSRFDQMSYQQIAFAVLLPAVAIPLAYKWKLNGFIVGQGFAYLAAALFMAKMVGFNFKPHLDWPEVRRLIRVGLPIAAVGLSYGLLTTVDRWVVQKYLGTTQLGYYSLTIVVGSVVTMLPKVLSDQIYPRMAETYGNTSDYRSLKRWIVGQIISTGAVLSLVVMVAFFALPPLVRVALPAYQPGILPMRISLIGFLFLPLAGAFGNFLNTVSKQMYYLAVQLFAIPLEIILSILLIRLGMGIEGVALAMAITSFLYCFALFLVGMRMLRQHPLPCAEVGCAE